MIMHTMFHTVNIFHIIFRYDRLDGGIILKVVNYYMLIMV